MGEISRRLISSSEISRKEIETAIGQLKINKAPGSVTFITAAGLKNGDGDFEPLRQFFVDCDRVDHFRRNTEDYSNITYLLMESVRILALLQNQIAKLT